MFSLSDVGPLLSGVGLVAGAIIAFFNLALPARKRKYMTVDAVRHHATYAMQNIQAQSPSIDPVRKKIQQDKSYHPYVVPIPEPDLSYSQVIEVLHFVKTKTEREQILDYYYNQIELNAIIASFSSEMVRGFPQERKLGLWNIYDGKLKGTLRAAKLAHSILDALPRRTW